MGERLVKTISALLLFLHLLPLMTFAQEGEKYRLFQFRDRAAQYYIGSEDELLIKVNIWGFVQKPGQYLVPSDTDLISLISYAGGPKEEAKIKSVKVVRNRGKGQKVFYVNIKKYLETGDETLIPQLMPGDTIIVSGSTFHWISKFFDFTAKLAVLVNIYYLIVLAGHYRK